MNTLNYLSLAFQNINPDSAILISSQAFDLSQKLKWNKGSGTALINSGLFYMNRDFEVAEDFFIRSLKIWENIGREPGEKNKSLITVQKTKINSNLGIIHSSKGNYVKALEFYFTALRLGESLGPNKMVAGVLGNIATVYYMQNDLDKAMDYYSRALAMDEKLGIKEQILRELSNIGMVSSAKGDFNRALEYYLRALKIAEENVYKREMTYIYSNIAVAYDNMSFQTESLPPVKRDSLRFLAKSYYLKALNLSKQLGNQKQIAVNLSNLADLCIDEKKYADGRKYLNEALGINLSLGRKAGIRNNLRALIKLDSIAKNYKSALDNYKLFVAYHDSMVSEENTKKQTRLEMQLEFDKKQAADSVRVVEEKKVAAAELKTEKNKRYTLYGGLVLILVFAGFLFNRFLITKKQKKIIEEQKHIVEKQKHIVEEKNKDILDSIYYARKIQRALLPTGDYIGKNLKRLRKDG